MNTKINKWQKTEENFTGF